MFEAFPSNSNFILVTPSCVTCPKNEPKRYASLIYGFNIGASSAVTFGKLRALTTAPVLR